MLDLPFRPDPGSAEPLYDQLAACLRDLIASGRLARGERLPPTRDLARSLGLSRNTVNRAYETLGAVGLLDAQVGRGTFVRGPAAEPGPTEAPPAPVAAMAWPALLSRRSRHYSVPALPPVANPIRIDLRPGRIDSSALPLPELERAYQRALRKLPRHANDLDLLGWAPLREALARRLVGRGIACEPNELLLVSGAQQALDLVARVLIDSGDSVAMEDPGYFGALLAFRSAGAQLVGIPVDGEGMRVEDLVRVQQRRRLACVYTTPAVQNPTTVALSAERRASLLGFAAREQVPIVEDDYDAELRGETAAPAALKERDPGDLVLYLGTFSKSLFPGLRLGYLLAPAALRGAFASARVTASMQPSLLDQMALAELMATDALDRHVGRMRRHYGRKRRALLDAIAAQMPPDVVAVEPAGGNGVWIPLPPRAEGAPAVDAAAALARAAEDGVSASFGATFCVEGAPVSALHLSCAVASPEEMREGVSVLARAIEHQRGA